MANKNRGPKIGNSARREKYPNGRQIEFLGGGKRPPPTPFNQIRRRSDENQNEPNGSNLQPSKRKKIGKKKSNGQNKDSKSRNGAVKNGPIKDVYFRAPKKWQTAATAIDQRGSGVDTRRWPRETAQPPSNTTEPRGTRAATPRSPIAKIPSVILIKSDGDKLAGGRQDAGKQSAKTLKTKTKRN